MPEPATPTGPKHVHSARTRTSKRSRARSRSGAQTPCPQCGKRLRGHKGLKTHMETQHDD